MAPFLVQSQLFGRAALPLDEEAWYSETGTKDFGVLLMAAPAMYLVYLLRSKLSEPECVSDWELMKGKDHKGS